MPDPLGTVVARVLRDEHMDRVLKDNEHLRDAQDKAARIEVTGLGGTPIYATGDIRQGMPAGSGERWQVPLEQVEDNTCLLSTITSLQITLGGIPLLHRNILERAQCSVLDFIFGCFNENDGFGLFEIYDLDLPNIASFSIRSGPFPDHHGYSAIDEDFDNQNPFRGSHMRLIGEEITEMSVRFEHVEWKLPEMLSCLGRFGISIEQATALTLPGDVEGDVEME